MVRVLVALSCTTHSVATCHRVCRDRGLHDNQLTTLPAGLFDSLTSLTELYVGG